MGIADRDYIRESSRGGFGEFAVVSVTTWLVILNVAAFVIDGIALHAGEPRTFEPYNVSRRGIDFVGNDGGASSVDWMGPVARLSYFSMTKAVYQLQLWRLIAFQFVHVSAGHLIGNMLGLFFFGPIVEAHFGARRYLAFYLSCGIAGAICYIVLWAFGLLVTSADVPLLGASAGAFGVLIAAAHFAPDMSITLWLPPIAIPIKTLAWISLAGAAYVVLFNGYNAGGEAAHVGGAVWGLTLVHQQHWLNVVVPTRRPSTTNVRKRPRYRKDWSKDMNR